MSKTPFMPLWVSDFLGDTMDLDAAEIGAYLLLLMAQWNRDGESLPNDSEKLKRICRCGRGWPKVWGVLERFFQTDENGIYSKRLRLEAASVASKREANAHNGALGGSAKALKNKDVPVANATVSPERNPSMSEPYPEIEKEEGKPSSKKTARRCRLPEGWVPSPRNVDDAHSQHFTDEEIENEARKFRDHHAAKATVFADWDAGWRTWLGNARRFQPRGNMAGGSASHRHGQGSSIASIVARRRLAGEV